jgi:hypothetical protein
MRDFECKYKKEIGLTLLKQIKGINILFSKPLIEFGYTCIRNDFLTIENQSYSLVVMVHYKF